MELSWYRNKKILVRIAVIAAIVFILYYLYFFRAPKHFPETALVTISDGTSLSEAAKILKDQNIIRSRFWFTNFVLLLKHERKVVDGEYYFERPLSVYQVAKRLISGDYHINQLKTTIPEGSTIFDISLILKKNYPAFDTLRFLALARNKEGYLFPDTYYFGADVGAQRVIDTLTSTFDRKITKTEVDDAIKKFGKPLKDIITMASILEGEARQMHTRQVVAGILWERIRLGIPLQVDASFKYINGKASHELTTSDLKIDSPYNTYVYKGLPPTPISNPGIESIMAAITPIKTDYLYFLTDKDGTMRYARTLEEHVANKQKYLK